MMMTLMKEEVPRSSESVRQFSPLSFFIVCRGKPEEKEEMSGGDEWRRIGEREAMWRGKGPQN